MCNPTGLNSTHRARALSANCPLVRNDLPSGAPNMSEKVAFIYQIDPLDPYTYTEVLSFEAWLHKAQLENYRKYVSSYRNIVQQEIQEAAAKLATNATDQNLFCIIEALTNIDDALADLQNKAI